MMSIGSLPITATQNSTYSHPTTSSFCKVDASTSTMLTGTSVGSNARFGGSISLSFSNPSSEKPVQELEPASPSLLEDTFCKNFNCCGLELRDMHELLQHSEECHRGLGGAAGGVCGGGGEDAEMEEDDLPFPFDVAAMNQEIDHDLLEGSNADQHHYLSAMHNHRLQLLQMQAARQIMPVSPFPMNALPGTLNMNPKTLSMQDIYCDTLSQPSVPLILAASAGRAGLNQFFPPAGKPSFNSNSNNTSLHPSQTNWFGRVEPIPRPNRSAAPTPPPSANHSPTSSSTSLTLKLHVPPTLQASVKSSALKSSGNGGTPSAPSSRPRVGSERHCNTCRSRKTSKWYKDHVDIGKYICKTCYNQIYKERLKIM